MSEELSGKVAVVTGGAKGIGRAVVAALAEAGAAVAVLDCDTEQGAALAAEHTTAGQRVQMVRADVSQPASLSAARDTVLADLGGVDILVTSAGIQRYGDVLTTSLETWNEVFTVNVTGAFLASQAFLPSLVERRGCVVHVASVQALGAFRDSVAYVSSKHALLGLTRSMASDHAPDVRVNCVAPGATDTPMLRASAARANPQDPDAVLRGYGDLHAMGRIAAASEVAAAVLFLAGPRASFVTGVCLPVDGGMTALLR